MSGYLFLGVLAKVRSPCRGAAFCFTYEVFKLRFFEFLETYPCLRTILLQTCFKSFANTKITNMCISDTFYAFATPSLVSCDFYLFALFAYLFATLFVACT